MRRLCHEVFRPVNERRGFVPIFPAAEVAVQRLGGFLRHPSAFGVVAEEGPGSCLQVSQRARSDPRAVGAIVTDRAAQGYGVGRRPMQAVLDRARGVRHPYPARALLTRRCLGCSPAVVWQPCIGRGAGPENEVANHSQLG
ncbi:MAG: hypothetical protein IRZ13_01415 [Acetobacteraceae bacterium]|nr:hypothetical protein [Acetobacteraceae bacterium]